MAYEWKNLQSTVTYSASDIAGIGAKLEDKKAHVQHDLALVIWPDETHDQENCTFCKENAAEREWRKTHCSECGRPNE